MQKLSPLARGRAGLARQALRRSARAVLVCAAFASTAATLVVPVCRADQTDARLDSLFQALKDGGPSAARSVETRIWAIWLESGREDVDALLAQGMEAMNARQLPRAIELFAQVVEMAPRFAEGWNKRATAHYLNDDMARSVQDIERTLALEPRHFGAISGMGLIFLGRGDDVGALHAFEQVLKVHPHATGAKARVTHLREKLEGAGI